jgi:hypothetical protein
MIIINAIVFVVVDWITPYDAAVVVVVGVVVVIAEIFSKVFPVAYVNFYVSALSRLQRDSSSWGLQAADSYETRCVVALLVMYS